MELQGLRWQFEKETDEWNDEDCTLKVHDSNEEAKKDDYYVEVDPKFPDIVTISSKGAAAEKQSSTMGIYKKMCRITKNDKPVWKMRGGIRYLFYGGNVKCIL